MPRLLQLTDTHIYADASGRFDGMDTRASFAAVLHAALADGRSDGLLLTGDLAMDGSAGAYAYLDQVLPQSQLMHSLFADVVLLQPFQRGFEAKQAGSVVITGFVLVGQSFGLSIVFAE